MKTSKLARAVSSVLSCALMAVTSVAMAADDEFTVEANTLAGLRTLDDDGDAENLERQNDGLDDGTFLESLDVTGGKGASYFSVTGRDLGQLDQSMTVEAGVYGKFKLGVGWLEQYRNYSDGRFLGTRTASGYWSVADATQQALEAGFVPLNANPTAAGQATLFDYLANSQKVSLDQRRRTGSVSISLSPSPGFGLRAGYQRQDRDGLKAVSSGSYRRAATGANAIGGLGESFRTYGLEFPMPIDYRTNTLNVGGDYRRNAWFVDFDYRYTQFDNEIGRVVYDNPLLFTGQSGQQGGAALHQMDLPPEYRSTAYTLTAGLRELPLRSRLTATFSSDRTTQHEPFVPYTVNRALLDDGGNVVADLALPASDLDGEVTTTLLNVVLNSRPLDPLAVNLRFNSYDYANDSRAITWDGWASIGEATWKDYDGSVAIQQPYRNRVPEYERTRYGVDGTWSFTPAWRLKGEYLNEKYDRNADRYADNKEDSFRLTLLATPVEWASLKLGFRTASRDIDGTYEEFLANGVQEEWGELRMFDMATRDRDAWDASIDLELGERVTVGLSGSQVKDKYDEEFYGRHEAKGTDFGADVSFRASEKFSVAAYYSREKLESMQLNRTKSDALGGGTFAVPQNDWATGIEDETDAYGIDIDATLMPDRLTLSLSADVARTTGKVDTRNTNFLAGTTVSGATAYPWPDTEIKYTELKAQLTYVWSEQLSTGLRYLYLKQSVDDFAIDNTRRYNGTSVDAQNNVQSHQIYMDANALGYKANVVMLTMSFAF
jgi:MtrB/PioB family decaheme-associated outer membrane protein